MATKWTLSGERCCRPPAQHVVALQDGEHVQLGEVGVIAWDTPGHARHHHAFVIGDVCFTGDVAGLRLQESPYLSVTAAPPQFDPAAYVHSVDRLIAGHFKTLYLTHFGPVQDVVAHLEGYRSRIEEVYAQVAAWFNEGVTAEGNRVRYTAAEHAKAGEAGVGEALWHLYEMGNGTTMCADGVRLYCAKNQ